MSIAFRILGALLGMAVGVLCLHMPVIGVYVGVTVIVGALAGLCTPLVQRGSLWQVLAMFALLFVAVYKIAPHLKHIGPHHWYI